MGKAKNPRCLGRLGHKQMTDKEATRTIRRTYLGQCEVEGCTARAVAYYHSAMWRLCATHSAQLASRSREKYE